MAINEQMLLIIESFTLGIIRYCHPHMHHYLHVVMNLLFSLLHLKNWSLFSVMRVRFTPMMTRGWMCDEKEKIVIKLKGQRRGLMVNYFIDEYTGFLALTKDEHTQGKVKYPDLQQEA